MWLATAANASAVPEVAMTPFTLEAEILSTTRFTSRVTNPRSAFQFAFARRIVTQKFIGEANGAEGKAHRVANVASLRDSQFATAAAKVHHQRGGRVDSGSGDKSKMNEPGFFNAGDDFNAPSGCGAYPFQKCLGIARVPQCAGRDHAHAISDDLLGRAMETAKNIDSVGDRFRSQKSRAKDALPETSYFAVFVKGTQTSALEARNFQSDGIGADIDCGECGHGRLTVYMRQGIESPESGAEAVSTRPTRRPPRLRGAGTDSRGVTLRDD